MEMTARGLPNEVSGTMVDAGGVPAELQKTDDAESLIIYFHGGGYIGGSIASHRNLTGNLALQSRCRVLSVEYRLAPEHPHPAAVEDAVTSYQWALTQGYEPHNIALAGDSAGGDDVSDSMIFRACQNFAPVFSSRARKTLLLLNSRRLDFEGE